MSDVGNILLKTDILLESGTNEVEILVFRVGGYTFGINVAKVREILPFQRITVLPNSHPSVVGCFQLRDAVVSCVSLHRHLKEESELDLEQQTIILTEFNQFQSSFLVDGVERIHKISWQDVAAVPSVFSNSVAPVTGIANIDGRIVSILDFEMIADQVAVITRQDPTIANVDNLPRETMQILLADDSPVVRKAARKTLEGSGYKNLRFFDDGEKAWQWIRSRFAEVGDASQVADMLVSDVEMPRLDGFRLTRNVKTHPALNAIPVVLYSSMLTPENLKKGQYVGADLQVTKPELYKIVQMADELLMTREARNGNAKDPTQSVPAKTGSAPVPAVGLSTIPMTQTQH